MWQENECEVYNIGFQIRNVCNYGKSYFATFPARMNLCKKSTAAFAVSI